MSNVMKTWIGGRIYQRLQHIHPASVRIRSPEGGGGGEGGPQRPLQADPDTCWGGHHGNGNALLTPPSRMTGPIRLPEYVGFFSP